MPFDSREQFETETELHEECGVMGVYDLDGGDVASTVYYGLVCPAAQRTGKLWYRRF